MKKIGFIDYYISEWHANNYPAWIREACEKNNLQFEIAYAWAEKDISPVDGVSTDEWCRKNNVERCESIKELCEKSDYILILAPTNPEKHLPYAKEALTFGKPTYIDKTFTPDLAEAKEIFAIAKRYDTPFFSTSALRYGEELNDFLSPECVMTTGGGSNLAEYLIHQVEMVVKLLKSPAKRVMVSCQRKQRICRVVTENGKEATMVYAYRLPFSVCSEESDGTSCYRAIKSDYFRILMDDILRFYESGKPSFDTAQTLEAMRLREAILTAEKTPDTWLDI